MTTLDRCDGERLVPLGEVNGLYGVRGWVRVYSYTDPRTGILDYTSWWLDAGPGWQAYTVAAGRRHGSTVVARLAGCEDRDTAASLLGARIAVPRRLLPPLPAGQYYLVDLLGSRVQTTAGTEIGDVDRLMDTGANDVLVVRGDRERLIPFAQGETVVDVDLERAVITVDWDPDWDLSS